MVGEKALLSVRQTAVWMAAMKAKKWVLAAV
jgi:hypothetical protein